MVFVLGEYRIKGQARSGDRGECRAGRRLRASCARALLPPMRELATELGVNPNTVAAAYRTLRERGVIETDGPPRQPGAVRPATTARDDIRVEVPPGVRDVADRQPGPRAAAAAGAGAGRGRAAGARRPSLYGDAPVDAGAGAAGPRRPRRRRRARRSGRRHLRLAGRDRARPGRPPQAGRRGRRRGPGLGQPAGPGAGARTARGAGGRGRRRARCPSGAPGPRGGRPGPASSPTGRRTRPARP